MLKYNDRGIQLTTQAIGDELDMWIGYSYEDHYDLTEMLQKSLEVAVQLLLIKEDEK